MNKTTGNPAETPWKKKPFDEERREKTPTQCIPCDSRLPNCTQRLHAPYLLLPEPAEQALEPAGLAAPLLLLLPLAAVRGLGGPPLALPLALSPRRAILLLRVRLGSRSFSLNAFPFGLRPPADRSLPLVGPRRHPAVPLRPLVQDGDAPCAPVPVGGVLGSGADA